MMDAVSGNPGDGAAFESECAANGESVIEPGRSLKRAVCVQPVVTEADPQPGRRPVKHNGSEKKLPGEEEETDNGERMENHHEDRCGPVQTF